MTHDRFKHVNFRDKSLTLIGECSDIVESYAGMGLRLTLRQLFYQLVTKNLIPNVERSYKNLSSLVSNARLTGQMDWHAIVDNMRHPRKAREYEGLKEVAEAALSSYRLPRWRDQHFYVELWVEKDALAGVLESIAWEYHITLMINRGYSSQTAMHDSAERFIYEAKARECVPQLLYLGDFDPSGEDMVRDIGARLEMFNALVDVTKVALTKAQIKKHKPPPNPAKQSDPRSKKFIAEHGASSWEVDALPPNVLQQYVREAIETFLDLPAYNKMINREKRDKARLRKAVRTLTHPKAKKKTKR